MLGTFVLSVFVTREFYYKKLNRFEEIVENKTQEILQKFDFILSPTTPHTVTSETNSQIRRKDI